MALVSFMNKILRKQQQGYNTRNAIELKEQDGTAMMTVTCIAKALFMKSSDSVNCLLAGFQKCSPKSTKAKEWPF
jgi:hypothetical protein